MECESSNDNADDKVWLVLCTMPNLEKRVYSELLDRNVEALLPLQEVIRKWSDRNKKIKVPLFPKYLFVRVNPKLRWKFLTEIKGTVKFLECDRKAQEVREQEIENIKKLINGNPLGTTDAFASGDVLKIVQGPLAGLEGVVINKNENTLAIRVSILRRYVIVKVSPELLKKKAA